MSKKTGALNFGKLFLGNSLGQVITLALYPYIAHFYMPEDFSKFGFIVSLTTLLSVFATGQFHTALLNTKEETEARSLIGLSTIMVTWVSIISAIFFLLYDLSLILVSVYLFAYSLNEIQKMYFIREKMYTASSISQVSFRLVGNGGKLLPSFIVLKSTGLVVSEITSLCIVVSYGLKKSVFNWKWHSGTFHKYRHFPIFQSITVAMNLVILDFPILFLSTRFDKFALGCFVMGQKLIVLPAIIVSNAIQSSTIHSFLESKTPFRSYVKLVLSLMLLGLVGYFAFSQIGAQILSLVLGNQWSGGAEIFTLLSLLFITKFAYAISQATFVLRNVTKRTFLIRSFHLGILFFLITTHLSFYETLKLYIIIDMIFDMILILLAGYVIRPPFRFGNVS
jgi:O-antigen/teichoic acid export membrane protein